MQGFFLFYSILKHNGWSETRKFIAKRIQVSSILCVKETNFSYPIHTSLDTFTKAEELITFELVTPEGGEYCYCMEAQ